ncbi:thiol-disulfide oxidoreductase DCC family protein [Lewinella sp. 4G2]|uniref:thiol-disulfide oxidoreductase DCC family protein n=1 Tax=Lewinella sp. 4G2 TaxID=1803372 RepID=UPI0007E014E8|nr:thiol-disulfide oxidoreductase DCC family protein [Lewinella sp. 4G2]OAV44095.1 thiol-disulfide oxidoreductase [Lewinella sp. 4G2]
MPQPSSPILFFDGVCNLCNGAVQWFLKNDRLGELRFASLQSDLARELLPEAGVDPTTLDSLVLYQDGRAYLYSDAALGAGRELGGLYGKLARAGGFFPRFLRDGVYKFIARNRYRWFGKREECMLPRPEWKARFVG